MKKAVVHLKRRKGVRQMIGAPQSGADRCATAWELRKSLLVVDLLCYPTYETWVTDKKTYNKTRFSHTQSLLMYVPLLLWKLDTTI